MFEISLGAGVGLGLTSCLYFAMLLAGVNSRGVLIAVELLASFVILLRLPMEISEAEVNVRLVRRNLRRGFKLRDSLLRSAQAVECFAKQDVGWT